jgi:hypothetical protein
MILTKLLLDYVRKFPRRSELPWPNDSLEEYFEIGFFYIIIISNMVSPIVAPPYPQGLFLKK